ncbi:MAG: hypothetical protein RBR53_10010 [Desulforegulaceae bacterium]|nr:hypothetical protein [Desulforegulaceae bacterium]
MTGEIQIIIPTSGKGGRTIVEEVYAYTNDNENKKVVLKITAKINSIVSIEPEKAHLWGKVGEEVKETIIITPRQNYEFKILDMIAANGKSIDYKLEKLENNSFSLVISNKKKEKGTYSDILFLKTDSKLKPALRINIFGNIK